MLINDMLIKKHVFCYRSRMGIFQDSSDEDRGVEKISICMKGCPKTPSIFLFLIHGITAPYRILLVNY